jgi:hypothetical protein
MRKWPLLALPPGSNQGHAGGEAHRNQISTICKILTQQCAPEFVPMKVLNFEFKARLRNAAHVRATLKSQHARFLGTDRQVDTYFRIPSGRLKIREGRIENSLIF